MRLLQDKIAFITGAASGIGKGTAIRFAQEGAKVALADMQCEEGRTEKPAGRPTTSRKASRMRSCDVFSWVIPSPLPA